MKIILERKMNAMLTPLVHEFADGQTLSYAELIGRRMSGVNVTTNAGGQQVVTGGQDDNTLTAVGGGSIFSGGRGNDALSGGGGGITDIIKILGGNDSLSGLDSSVIAVQIVVRLKPVGVDLHKNAAANDALFEIRRRV